MHQAKRAWGAKVGLGERTFNVQPTIGFVAGGQVETWLSVETILFSAFGYQMSYLEFAGTLLNLWSVWLVVRNRILNWPVGIAGSILFGLLFYQIQLYSDLIEQVYYVLSGFYGWWVWQTARIAGSRRGELPVTASSRPALLATLAIIAFGSAGLGLVISQIDVWLPAYFPEPASYPYLDAWTTVMSFAAQILMARKKVESWFLWITVDIVGIGLYAVKGVVFVALLYLIFLVLATRGLIEWRKLLHMPVAVAR